MGFSRWPILNFPINEGRRWFNFTIYWTICYTPVAIPGSTFSHLIIFKKNFMTTQTNFRNLFLAILLFAGYTSFAQKTNPADNARAINEPVMKSYLIEREIPNAGKLTAEELKAISQTSCSVLKEMGPKIQWVHSYVTGNKIYCIYKAENAELIKEHAKKGGFPANTIVEIATVISPATAD
jgi:hypothetical protein